MSDKIAKTDGPRYPAIAGDIGSILAENLGGEALSPSDLDRVKVPAGGGIAWEVPGIDGTDSEKEIVGVIVHQATQRAYWSKEYSGENVKPDCSSRDSVHGVAAEGIKLGGLCAECPMSQWDSDPKGGSGQACKLTKQLFVLRPGGILPIVVTLPPSSIGAAKKYMVRLASQSVPYYGAETSITLEKAQSGGGITYSKAVFKSAGRLSPEDTAAMRAYGAGLAPALAAVDVEQADVA